MNKTIDDSPKDHIIQVTITDVKKRYKPEKYYVS